ncbi:alpha/beta fold hydrolase [Tomitella fengzijianii]|uniref:Alpha/beta fold hydrolase n=1 Tax=Tomitella fengzijianii TaxID=2597660 RepID=A0A516X323_9ACTN|nr:alpha/beta fold hydrolase [Tomitella fengzijianii]QDQ97041.1 alpha/beta fold hydrolase [Tomitella fengzijianii]
MTRPVTRRRTVTRGHISLAVFEHGDPDGPTVLLVHGWPDTHRLWDGVVPALAEHHRVVTYDTRGHGESTVPGAVSGFGLHEFADDLYAVIDAVSPDRKVHLVGHDWGSVQGWEAVCRTDADERIATFTSISGPSLDHLAVWVRARLRRPTARGVGQALGQLASSAYTGFFMTPVLPRLFFRAAGRPALWRRFLRVIDGTPPDRIHLAPSLQRDMISGLRIYTANIVPRLRRPDPRTTTVPVRLLVNRRDIALRPAIYSDAEQWVTELSRTDLATGHWLPFHSPDVIAQAVAEFAADHGVDG